MRINLHLLIICIEYFELRLGSVVPDIACPTYFAYVYERSRFYGKVILPHLVGDFTKLDVELTQKTPVTNGYFGNIALDGSEDDIKHDMPVSYRIEFPTLNEVPKLSKLSVNGAIICIGNDSEYDTPTTLTLQHNLTYHSAELPRENPRTKWTNGNSFNKPTNLFQPVVPSIRQHGDPSLAFSTEAPWSSSFRANEPEARVVVLPGKSEQRSQILNKLKSNKVIIVHPKMNERQSYQTNHDINNKQFPESTASDLTGFPISLTNQNQQYSSESLIRNGQVYRHQMKSSILSTTPPSFTIPMDPKDLNVNNPRVSFPMSWKNLNRKNSNDRVALPTRNTNFYQNRLALDSVTAPIYNQNDNPMPAATLNSELFTPVEIVTEGLTSSPITRSKADNSLRCGKDTLQFTPYVYGGSSTVRGQMPWITPIYRKASANLHFLCSGSLISSRTVITAAHCVVNQYKLTIDRIVVYLGRHDLDDYSEQGYQVRELRNFIVHPEYLETKLSDADLALLILKNPVNFTRFIAPVCLWDESFSISAGGTTNAFLAGWGADEYGHQSTNEPKMISVNIISNEECFSYPEYSDFITERTLCAGNHNGTGPCLGDSGAGLIVSRNQRWVIRATVSGGLKSSKPCDRQKFVVYCDLSKHFEWIQSNMLD